ncbi:MAG: aminotransferase class V-fold PLP-dependent enzyme [Balneolaceae bacterium]|nr:aminotransferase class V-fold PLP-dependent enzyme [Balneolaceae bacterium]MBO6545233.1 aminotransferase class V-fold PLP-dependent enzyme [Balneolaceae bacterium]MBO6646629.1 aminotransferase class V-fold PLP-dependent enzyme [Balneolaceae bacterium]
MLNSKKRSLNNSFIRVVGEEGLIPLRNGKFQRYINFDNAASTPSFESVSELVRKFLPYYSSVHRGAGYKSQLSTEVYDKAHNIVAEFIGADTSENTVIFTKNATEALNKLSYRFPFKKDSVVLTTEMEHHSNDLPWRDKAETIHVRITEKGTLDLDDLDTKLKKYAPRVSLVCVSGASNVTGIVQPIHTIAKMAHDYDAKIVVDAAQLAPHKKIDIRPNDDLWHIDFLVFSAHKMYAPFGTGVLVGPKDTFLNSAPEYSGGGTVESVTLNDIRWADLPDREEAGSPNVIGAVALAKAIQTLTRFSMDKISRREKKLTRYAIEKLGCIKGITIYGDRNVDRVGVISFNLAGVHHQEVADILSTEFGIGVRNGCFCAHPYVVKLLRLSDAEIKKWRDESLNGHKNSLPGLVRVSFGCYNTFEEVDLFSEAIEKIVADSNVQSDIKPIIQLDTQSKQLLSELDIDGQNLVS